MIVRSFVFFLMFMVVVACKEAKKETVTEQVKRDLPNMAIRLMDGSVVQLGELNEKSILIFFLPECDHCEREAADIRNNLDKFAGYKLYFISGAEQEKIWKFAADYELVNKSNVIFGYTAPENIMSSYGSIETPSLYIYNEQGRLMHTFNGETDARFIVNHL